MAMGIVRNIPQENDIICVCGYLIVIGEYSLSEKDRNSFERIVNQPATL